MVKVIQMLYSFNIFGIPIKMSIVSKHFVIGPYYLNLGKLHMCCINYQSIQYPNVKHVLVKSVLVYSLKCLREIGTIITIFLCAFMHVQI